MTAVPGTLPLEAYRTPGVRVEFLDVRPQGETLAREDITGFLGIASRGPLHLPVRVETWSGFTGVFGGHDPRAYLAYAVESFFQNGGRTCWVVRVADPDRAQPASADLCSSDGTVSVTLSAVNPGAWGRGIEWRVDRAGDRFTLTVQLPREMSEAWRDLSLTGGGDEDRSLDRMVNDSGTGSRLVRATVRSCADPPSAGRGRLHGGADGLGTLTTQHLTGEGGPEDHPWGLAALARLDGVGLVVMPDAWTRPVAPAVEPLPPARTPCTDLGAASGESARGDIHDDPEDRPPQRNDDEVQDLQQRLIAHCEELGDRVALLEPPRNTQTPADAVTWRGPLGSAHAALYHPWLRVRDPLDPDGDLASIPPAAAAAGVCARVDALIGVHAPPANQVVEGVLDVVVTVDDLDHGTLNDADVNVIRVQPGRGIRLLGARTVARDGEWRYLNVRRLLLAVEASIRQAARTAVFEPNGPPLWKDVERGARGVLDQAWQRGMLAGATAAQAYDVRCDATTNPPEETAAGRLICLVGVQPPYPAEFVVIRVVQEVSNG